MINLMKAPAVRASINQEGYVCLPSHMQMLKNSDKQDDISKYPKFGMIAKKVIDGGYTCLHYDRLYTIWQALDIVYHNAPIDTIEIGVYKGGTSRFIVDSMREISHGARHSHHCFDTFEGHARSDISSDDMHKPGQFNDADIDAVGELIGKDGLIYPGRFEDTCSKVSGVRFCFAHLDVDLYGPTRHALDFLASRMKDDGIIVVDDYASTSCPGVKKAVDLFIAADPKFFSLHLLTGQAIIFRRR